MLLAGAKPEIDVGSKMQPKMQLGASVRGGQKNENYNGAAPFRRRSAAAVRGWRGRPGHGSNVTARRHGTARCGTARHAGASFVLKARKCPGFQAPPARSCPSNN